MSTKLNGATWLVESLKASGINHFFFVDAVLRRSLLEMERLGVQPVLAHTEKAAVYMADAYGRIAGVPGVVAAQSVTLDGEVVDSQPSDSVPLSRLYFL